MPKTLYSAADLLELAGVSRATFARWCALGLVPEPAERVQEKQGGSKRRYWTAAQVAALTPLILDSKRGLSTSELAQKYGRDTH